MVRALELFSGTGSVGKVLRAQGHETVSLDIDPRFGPDLCMNILDFDETAYPRDHFDAVWASCPCEAYSKARSNAIIPRDVVMTASDKLVVKTRQIIAYFTDALWIVENPATSLMWTREAAKGLGADSVVTSYCAFGFPYQQKYATRQQLRPLAPPLRRRRRLPRHGWPQARRTSTAWRCGSARRANGPM